MIKQVVPTIFLLLILSACAAPSTGTNVPSPDVSETPAPPVVTKTPSIPTEDISSVGAAVPEYAVISEKNMLTLDSNKIYDDSAQLLQCTVEGDGYPYLAKIDVKLGNGTVYSKTYDEICRNPYLRYADLTGNGIDELILALPVPASNYNATDVHVLSVTDDGLTEILTVLCNPETVPDKYRQTLFEIPNPPDNFSLTERSEYTSFCTGVSITNVNGQAALWIRHLEGEVTPYSALLWNGSEWVCTAQDVDDSYTTSYNAAVAFLSADAEKLSKYMLHSEDAEEIAHQTDIYDTLTYFILKSKTPGDTVPLDKMSVSYEFMEQGGDSFSYVTMELTKTGGEWKVVWIGAEK